MLCVPLSRIQRRLKKWLLNIEASAGRSPKEEEETALNAFYGLTRIRPNNCAFKDAFFGSNPLEFNCGAVNIGHGWHFTGCGEAEQSEAARSGSGRQSPQGVQHSHRTGLQRLDQALHRFSH